MFLVLSVQKSMIGARTKKAEGRALCYDISSSEVHDTLLAYFLLWVFIHLAKLD